MVHRLGRLGRRPPAPSASHGMRRRVWLIDLDNTLHDASWRLMTEINRRMTDFVAGTLSLSSQEASALRARYWHRYGATLLGLVRHHGVDPDVFLRETHPDHDLEQYVMRAPGLRRRLALLPGQRWLVTNAPRAYTNRLLGLLGISRCFHRLVCIDDMHAMTQLRPKPSAHLWARLLRAARRPAREVCLIDDSAPNLRTAHRAGIRTARLWASPSQRRLGWRLRRPMSALRPSYVRVQVNSWTSLIRQVGIGPQGRP